MTHSANYCPIRYLRDAITSATAIPFAWAVEWIDAQGTIQRAWDAAREPRAMVDLLRSTDLVAYRLAVDAWQSEVDDIFEEDGACSSWRDVRDIVTAAIRRVVPVPPSIDEILAAAERIRRNEPATEMAR